MAEMLLVTPAVAARDEGVLYSRYGADANLDEMCPNPIPKARKKRESLEIISDDDGNGDT